MEIIYTTERNFSTLQLEELFSSVGWISGRYAERLKKALDNCETVYTAWAGDKLVGLVNAIDDGELTAYVHYLCVSPEYQGTGVGSELLRYIREKYKDYMYIILIAENNRLINFYIKNGFVGPDDCSVMEIMRF